MSDGATGPHLRGSVALSGLVATYFAEPGYTGPDNFAYLGSDSGGYVDSTTAGVVSVTVGTASASFSSSSDGIPDLVKYALGLSPGLPSSSGVTAPTITPFSGVRYLTMSVARFLPPSDVTLTIEVSGDLQTWLPATVIINTSSLLQVRDPIPADSAARRFMRVKATRP